MLAGHPDHLAGSEPFPLHGEEGPERAVPGGAADEGAPLAGERRADVQSLSAPIRKKRFVSKYDTNLFWNILIRQGESLPIPWTGDRFMMAHPEGNTLRMV